MNYYLDESGNSGDLINQKSGLGFGNQPIFTLSCIGIKDQEESYTTIESIKSKYRLSDNELKSSDLYYDKPELLLDIAKYLTEARIPTLVELVDKKFCIATSIVNHHIHPLFYDIDETDGKMQFIRNILADYITNNLTDDCYLSFFNACISPSEENLLTSMNKLKDFFISKEAEFEGAELTKLSIIETIDDYNVLKSEMCAEEAVKKFLPIPDTTKKGVSIKLLPHVHSIFNIIARLNKYHLKDLSNISLFHDNQDDFDDILIYCNELLESIKIPENSPPTINSDFDIKKSPSLNFVESNESIGIQIADLVAGFFNRYVNGWLYSEVEIDEIYHLIFKHFRNNFSPRSPLGVNFVIPESKQQIIFREFNF